MLQIEFYTAEVSSVHLDSKGFGRWRVTLEIVGSLDFVHRPDL
jgi:hypothetical protein